MQLVRKSLPGQRAYRWSHPGSYTHLSLSTGAIHTVKPLKVKIPKGRLTVVTGVSGSGKTTLILESLVPGIEAAIAKTPMPSHVLSVDPAGISQVKLIDATPIGINVRSTAATYANVHDEMCIRDRSWSVPISANSTVSSFLADCSIA